MKAVPESTCRGSGASGAADEGGEVGRAALPHSICRSSGVSGATGDGGGALGAANCRLGVSGTVDRGRGIGVRGAVDRNRGAGVARSEEPCLREEGLLCISVCSRGCLG